MCLKTVYIDNARIRNGVETNLSNFVNTKASINVENEHFVVQKRQCIVYTTNAS